MKSIWSIYDRALEIIDYMDRKYVKILEEIVIEEAEILSKKELTDVDRLRLIGIWAMKDVIAEELGLRESMSLSEYGELYSVTREVLVNA